MPEAPSLPTVGPTAGARTADAQRVGGGASVFIRRALGACGIAFADATRRAAVQAPKDVKASAHCLPIRLAVAAAQRLLPSGLVQRTQPSVGWTLSADSTLADLPKPPDGPHWVLTAREVDGRMDLRWSRDRGGKISEKEVRLATEVLGQLVAREVGSLGNEREFVDGVEHTARFVGELLQLTPWRLNEVARRLDKHREEARGAIVQRLRDCVVSRVDQVPAAATQHEAQPLPTSSEETALIERVLDDMPTPVLQAAHHFGLHMAAELRLDDVGPDLAKLRHVDRAGLDVDIGALARAQQNWKNEIGAAGSWAALKEMKGRLEKPPTSGRDVCEIHDIMAKLLAAQAAGVAVPDGPHRRIELLESALRRFDPALRGTIDLEGALLGAVLAFRLSELKQGTRNGPGYGIDFNALKDSVSHPETRAAVERALESVKRNDGRPAEPEPAQLPRPGLSKGAQEMAAVLSWNDTEGVSADEEFIDEVERAYMNKLLARYR